MTPKDYFNEIVLPTFHDFERNRLSRRHAYLACIAIYHIKDHLKAAGEDAVEVGMRASGSRAFDLVRSICNGSKHVSTNGSHKIEFHAGADYRRPPSFAGVAMCGLSYFRDKKGGREIRYENRRLDIFYACYETIELFKKNYPSHLIEDIAASKS